MSIIVGDIHGDTEKARTFLAYKPDEEHVALGDYLDSYIEPLERQLECLNLLMDSGAVLLLGNHECHYLKNPLFQFAGYQLDNVDTIQNILETNLDRFKAAFVADGWLCTHAGVCSQYTEQESNVAVLADTFDSTWELYLKNRMVDREASFEYQSIFWFNYFFYVEGNLLAENIKQIFGHVELKTPEVTETYVALDTTNFSNSCWIYDTAMNELVPLPMETKIGRVRFQGGGWM